LYSLKLRCPLLGMVMRLLLVGLKVLMQRLLGRALPLPFTLPLISALITGENEKPRAGSAQFVANVRISYLTSGHNSYLTSNYSLYVASPNYDVPA